MTLQDLSTWLDGLADVVSQPLEDIPGLESRVSDIVSQDIGRCFADSRSPDGSPWLPLKRGQRQPLIDTGALLAAALDMGRRATVDASRTGVRIDLDTSGLPAWADFQDAGTRTIPARPFIGFSEDAAEQVGQAAAELWGLDFTRRVNAWVNGEMGQDYVR